MTIELATNQENLPAHQVETYLRDGVLVVDNLLSQEELEVAWEGLHETLSAHGVELHDLVNTGHNLCALSSTNGAGGVLDVFYEHWKLEIATNKRLLAWTQQLWRAAYCSHDNGEGRVDVDDEDWKWHPFGSFDPSQAFVYIDRIGYRIPSTLAEKLGEEHCQGKKRKLPIQRSLTPHLDCCPDTFDKIGNKSKWRPIQCFVSLTENLEANTGGFEAAKGFHRDFRKWAKTRPPTFVNKGGTEFSRPAPCVGEYTHIRPMEDAMVMEKMQHVCVRAGSAVFWDSRIPHANAYRHNGDVPRAVVYCSFLPNVLVNRQYVKEQLEKWKLGNSPTDQWIHPNKERDEKALSFETILPKLTQVQRCLLGIDPWDDKEKVPTESV
ncbi:hypothetical protein ACA910_004849 [Epithemia clementina (nom. ined.)]